MSPLDYGIVAVYLLAVTVVGSLCFRGQKSLADFFLGRRNIPWWAASFSGIATVLSAVSFLGAPGQAFKSDLRFLQYRLATPVALFIIGWIMIPFFYRLRVYSIYEYLELRFDLKTRLIASAQFFLLKALFLGIAIYAPALLFVQMTGWPLLWIVLAIGLFTTLYTSIGGVKAVIWTDTLQLAILFGGLFVAARVILERTGGAAVVRAAAEARDKLRFFDFSLDPNAEFTIWGGLIGGVFVLLSQYGVNQAELQKMLTTSSVGRSRIALISSMTVASLVGLAYFLIGAGLFVFYSQHPEKNGMGMNPDRVFPRFIIEELPSGVKGLLMAAVAAAAMSAISSILNAVTTVVTSDFYNRLSGRQAGVATARWLTLGLGILCTLTALYVDRLGNLLVAATRLQNFLGGSLTGAFLLGMTVKRANGSGAFWGVVIGTAGVLWLAAATSVSWMWHGAFAAALAYGSGWLLSLGSPPPAPKTAELVWSLRS